MSRRCHHGSARHAPLGRVPRRPAPAMPERHAAPAAYLSPMISSSPSGPHSEPIDEIEIEIESPAAAEAELVPQAEAEAQFVPEP